MEKSKCFSVAVPLLAIVLMSSTTKMMMMRQVSGQITTACTAALISSFTPCLNYITGSTNGDGSPTDDCCQAIGSVISSSTDCACLILTGNVPFSLPVNRTLAISLPRMCNSKSVPLECKGTSAPLPSPGTPLAFGPSLPPLPPFSSAPPPPPPALQAPPPAPSPNAFGTPADQGFNQAQRPLVLPNSAGKLTHACSMALSAVLVLVLGILLFK